MMTLKGIIDTLSAADYRKVEEVIGEVLADPRMNRSQRRQLAKNWRRYARKKAQR